MGAGTHQVVERSTSKPRASLQASEPRLWRGRAGHRRIRRLAAYPGRGVIFHGVTFHVHAVAKRLPYLAPAARARQKPRQHQRRWAGLVDSAGRKDGLKTQEEEAVAQRRESVRRLESLRTDMRTACDAYRAFAQREGR